MSNEIIVVEAQPRVLATEHVPRIAEQARNEFVRDALSNNTQRAYDGALARFRAWMLEHDETQLTADVISRWIASLAQQKRSVSSIRQSLAAVRWAMRQKNLPDVGSDHLVRMTLRGIARTHSADQSAPKDPILRDELEKLLAAIDATHEAGSTPHIYKRALVLFAWTSAMRRSEIVALRWKHLRYVEGHGFAVSVVRSKGDQTGQGQDVPIPLASDPSLCASRALRVLREKARWFAGPNDADRPVFCAMTAKGFLRAGVASADRALLEHVRRIAKLAGLDPKAFGMHSFRSGFATEAAQRGRGIERIQQHLRHKSASTTARYVKRGRLFEDSSANGIL
jgi:site-specific recombinase XerD